MEEGNRWESRWDKAEGKMWGGKGNGERVVVRVFLKVENAIFICLVVSYTSGI